MKVPEKKDPHVKNIETDRTPKRAEQFLTLSYGELLRSSSLTNNVLSSQANFEKLKLVILDFSHLIGRLFFVQLLKFFDKTFFYLYSFKDIDLNLGS